MKVFNKIKKSEICFLGTCALIVGAISLGFMYNDYRNKLFKHPENLAQKVANYVVKNHDMSEGINYSRWVEEDKAYGHFEGKRYKKRVTSKNQLYQIQVDVIEEGSKDLKLDFYFTNQDFSKLKTAEDFVVREFEQGNPKMFIAKHFSDRKIDGELDSETMYVDEREHGQLEGFTKEEIDRKDSEVKKFSIYEGRVLKDGKWVDAPEDKKATQEDYEGTLKEVAAYLRIIKE